MIYNARNEINDAAESQKERLIFMLIFSTVSHDVIIKKLSNVKVKE